MANGRVNLPRTAVHKLADLVSQAAELDTVIKLKSQQLDGLKQLIRDLVEKYGDQLPIISSSRIIPLSNIGKQLRVTYTTSAPRLDYDELRDKVGGEVFMRITHPTAWELVPEDVNSAINDELLKESDLVACLRDAPPRKPSVSWDILKGIVAGNEEE